MSTVQAVGTPELVVRESGHQPGWWGMVLLILTEAALFASLLLSYFYERSNAAQWPPDGIADPELGLVSIMTVLLLLSSAPMAWAEYAIRHGNQGGLRLGLALSWLLGVSFLGLQVIEYSNKAFSLDTNVYGSLFFTITSLHALHLIVALLLSAMIQLRAWLGHFDEDHNLAVQNVAIYWHFVDAVWIFILVSLYISPYLL